MGEMQAQIQEFIASLNRELAARTSQPRETEGRNSLIPVVSALVPAPGGMPPGAGASRRNR
jgi:hypothetical protein